MVTKTTKKNSLSKNLTPSESTLQAIKSFARSFQSKSSEVLKENIDWILN
jgi:hypothetical protein